MIFGDPLALSTLLFLGLLVGVLGFIPGALVLRLSSPAEHDSIERWCAAFAAPGVGLILFGGLAGGAVWTLGWYSPGLVAAIWGVLCGALSALVWRRTTGPGLHPGWGGGPILLCLMGGFLAVAVAVFWPVRDFPVSPDYDGTADGYLATIVSLDRSYPKFRTFGNEFIEVTIPPSAAVTGAFVSDVTGVFPGRVQLALAGCAGVFYLLALPWAGWPILRRWTTWPWLAILPGLLGYQWFFKTIYYDGSNLRLYGALGLVLATGFWLRATEGSRAAAVMAGVMAGSTLYFHHRFFLYAGISGVAHVLYESVRALSSQGGRGDWRRLMTSAAVVAAFALLVTLPFLASALPHASATSANPLWAQSRLPGFGEFVKYVDRMQGAFVFFATPLAALLALMAGGRFPAVRFLAAACLGQSLFAFDEITHRLLPFLASYLDRADLATSAFLESRPILFAALLALACSWLGSRWPRAEQRVGMVVLGLATVGAVTVYRMPASFCYTYLSRGDYQALTWIRNNTPREGTLVLAYAYDDISDTEMTRAWTNPSPRLSFNAESLWVAPVSNRRAVFHWVNRHTHQKAWATLADFSPTLPGALSALNRAYMNPDLPESLELFRKHGVTHLFYPFYMHLSFRTALLRAAHLRQVFLAPPPIDVAYGRDSPPRDSSPVYAAAVYEVGPSPR